jgi:UDP-N-acetylmuramate-alanine ligase
MKRRLEKRYIGNITVFDDIAHSPEKASTVLNNLKEIYPGKIVAVFEPNIGGRSRESISKYNNSFKDADVVIIPRLSKLKIGDTNKPMEGDELVEVIKKTHKNAIYIEDDNNLIKFLVENTKKGDCVAFLGSHGFRNMIEEFIISLRQQSQ